MTDQFYNATEDELRQFIERYEHRKAKNAEMQKEVMTGAKGRGYDTAVLRKRKTDDIAGEAAGLEMYVAALGML